MDNEGASIEIHSEFEHVERKLHNQISTSTLR